MTGKFLQPDQRKVIADAVKCAPTLTAQQLIHNWQESPTKKIDPQLKKSVERMVRKVRKTIESVSLEGVELDGSIGSLQALSDKVWFEDARKAHVAGVKKGEPACIPLHRVHCIARALDPAEQYVFLAFATPWNLLNYFRAIGSDYPVMLQGDVTSKASCAAINTLGLGFNRLGGHFTPWTSTLIPAEQETEGHYQDAYDAARLATRAVIALPSCSREDCHTCSTIRELRANPR